MDSAKKKIAKLVANVDIYKGSMVNNYYLYGKDVKMSMVPWN